MLISRQNGSEEPPPREDEKENSAGIALKPKRSVFLWNDSFGLHECLGSELREAGPFGLLCRC